MTVIQIRCLEALRLLGPSSNADVARKLGVSLDTTYRAIVVLTAQGYVTHPKKQEWIITRLGLKRIMAVHAARPKLMEMKR